MATLSLHRALAELKLADAKISKKIAAIMVVGYKKEQGLVNEKTKLDDFNKEAQSQHDSITALVNRKNTLKALIVKANAETVVEIAGQKMTIAEAITRKDSISIEEQYLQALKNNRRKIQATVESHNTKIDTNALKLVETALGKDNADENAAIAIKDGYVKSNQIELVDPLGLDKIIEVLEEDISNFKAEVDASLSEINATTFIEIED